MRHRTSIIAIAVVILLGAAVTGFSQKPGKISDFMQLKLTHAQTLLEGLALEDYEMIAKSAQSLSIQSMEATWKVFETPEYLQHSGEFRQAADAVAEAARKKNLDGAALAYVGLTLKCVNCHKHVRDVRMAGRTLDLPPHAGGE